MKASVVRDSLDHISEAATLRSAATLIPERSILVVTRSGILAHSLPVAINAIEVTINQDLKALTPGEGLSSDYLAYALKANERTILDDCVKDGTTVHSVEVPSLLNFELPIAPTREQHRIVAKIEELFSELDKAVESLTRARAQLKTYRQALLKAAFEGKLTADWRAANPDKLEPPETLLARIRAEREARYKQALADWQTALDQWRAGGIDRRKSARPAAPAPISEIDGHALQSLPPLPTGWAYVRLENLGDLARGKSRHRPRNDPRLFGGPYPFIQTGEVKAAGRRVADYTQTYSEFGLAQSRLWPQGTLCITIAANIAETALLGIDACFPDSVVGFTAQGEIVDPEFVELFIKAVRVRIAAYAPATAQKNINLTTLEELIIPLCSRDEQVALVAEIERQFSILDNEEAGIGAALLRIATARQSILRKAFSGQLVPQDPTDEPATALLTRLRERTPAPRTPRRKTA